ncbi:hypothetical protein MTO96_048847 [Rhipicephalus appendiculatus]
MYATSSIVSFSSVVLLLAARTGPNNSKPSLRICAPFLGPSVGLWWGTSAAAHELRNPRPLAGQLRRRDEGRGPFSEMPFQPSAD